MSVDTQLQPARRLADSVEADISTESAPVSARRARVSPSFWRELGGLAIKVVVIVLAFGLLFTFVYGLHRSIDADMEPASRAGDLVLFYRFDKDYAIGDLLLVDFEDQMGVRRVVAREGDIVDISQDGLLVNNSLQQEPNIYRETSRYVNGIDFPVTVGPGQVFVLGDARQNATDSRVYGPVNISDTYGTVISIIRWRSL